MFRKPFTHVAVRPYGTWHAIVVLWINHAHCGELIVRTEEIAPTIEAISDKAGYLLNRREFVQYDNGVAFEDDDWLIRPDFEVQVFSEIKGRLC